MNWSGKDNEMFCDLFCWFGVISHDNFFLFFYREDMGFKLVAEQVRVNKELESRLLFGFKSA